MYKASAGGLFGASVEPQGKVRSKITSHPVDVLVYILGATLRHQKFPHSLNSRGYI